jgi:hypothetical protein
MSIQFFLSSYFFLEFSNSRTSSESHSTTFAKQSFREKIVFTPSAVFPTGDITFLHSRVSQTYITTNHGELSSDVTGDIRNGYRLGEGGSQKASL